MNKLFKSITALVCIFLMLFSFSVSAAGERITTSDVKVKSGSLFEVKIGFKSSRTITAARFKLSYNPDEISARQPVCNLSRAKVRFVDNNGITDIIFLCSGGVKCSEFPTLFTMKYKRLSNKNTTVKISAYDCVDNHLSNFKPPQSAVCKVKIDASSPARGQSGRTPGDAYEDSDDYDNEDILETSGNIPGAGDSEEEVEVFSGGDYPIYLNFFPVFTVVIMLILFALILYQNMQLKKKEKRKEEENQNNTN